MSRWLTIWLSMLLILAQHSPQTGAQPSTMSSGQTTSSGRGRVWIDDVDDADKKRGTKSKGTWIDLYQRDVSVESMARISTLKGVTDLDIGYCPELMQIDDKALAKIGNMKGLRGLNFCIIGVKEKDWSFLAKLSKLEYLHVDGEQLNLGDDFLRFVSRLKSLKMLRIGPHSNFSDDGIGKLGSLQNLTELSLSSSLMTDQSLKTIGELKKLDTLYLWSPHISDDAAKQMIELKKYKQIDVGHYHRNNCGSPRLSDSGGGLNHAARTGAYSASN